MSRIKGDAVLHVVYPRELIPGKPSLTERKRALKAIISGALAEFKIFVTGVEFIDGDEEASNTS